MEDLKQQAIVAVKAYLIDLLKNDKYCRARSVGDALVILIQEELPSEEEIAKTVVTWKSLK